MKTKREHSKHYKVPEGYFDNLKKELYNIPEENKGKVLVFRASWKKVLAVAAAVMIGLFFLWPDSNNNPDDLNDEMLMAYLSEEAYLDYDSYELMDVYVEWDGSDEYVEDENFDYLNEYYTLDELMLEY